jgi:hypothetical protein
MRRSAISRPTTSSFAVSTVADRKDRPRYFTRENRGVANIVGADSPAGKTGGALPRLRCVAFHLSLISRHAACPVGLRIGPPRTLPPGTNQHSESTITARGRLSGPGRCACDGTRRIASLQPTPRLLRSVLVPYFPERIGSAFTPRSVSAEHPARSVNQRR